jgi:S-adenosylmethionine/arginine decarboxylase-like enzyme
VVTAMASKKVFGWSLQLDLGGCDPAVMRDRDKLCAWARDLCYLIDMTAYGPTIAEHFGNAYVTGWSVMQLIETSLISAHFVEEDNSVYADVFSCKEFDPDKAGQFTQERFGASAVRATLTVRRNPLYD